MRPGVLEMKLAAGRALLQPRAATATARGAVRAHFLCRCVCGGPAAGGCGGIQLSGWGYRDPVPCEFGLANQSSQPEAVLQEWTRTVELSY